MNTALLERKGTFENPIKLKSVAKDTVYLIRCDVTFKLGYRSKREVLSAVITGIKASYRAPVWWLQGETYRNGVKHTLEICQKANPIKRNKLVMDKVEYVYFRSETGSVIYDRPEVELLDVRYT